MSRFLTLRFFLLLALAVGGNAVHGQSFVQNPVWKPHLRIKIPTVQPIETDGYATNEFTFSTSYGNQTVYDIYAKLNPLRSLKFCDFVLKAIDQTTTGEDNGLVYLYSSTPLFDSSGTPLDPAASVYFLDASAPWPECVHLKSFEYNGIDSIQDVSNNSATCIEIWPDTDALSAAGISQRSRNILWVCLLLNGVDSFKDQKSGNQEWFPVNVEWRQFPPNY